MKTSNSQIFGDVRSVLAGNLDFPFLENYTGFFLQEAILGWLIASAEEPQEILAYLIPHPGLRRLSLSEILHAQACYDHGLTLEHFGITDESHINCGFPRQEYLPFEVSFRAIDTRVECNIRIRGIGAVRWRWQGESREEAFRLALGDFMYRENHPTLKAYSQWVKRGLPPQHFGLPNRPLLDLEKGWEGLRVKKDNDRYFRYKDTIRIGTATWEYDEAGYFVNHAFAFAMSPEVSEESFAVLLMTVLNVRQDQSLKKAAVFVNGDNFNRYTRPSA